MKPEGPLKFGTLEQGYETAPDAKPVTVENTGTEAIRIQLSAPEDYEVGELSAEVLNPGDKAATFIRTAQDRSSGRRSQRYDFCDRSEYRKHTG